jgi:hypothetical protein
MEQNVLHQRAGVVYENGHVMHSIHSRELDSCVSRCALQNEQTFNKLIELNTVKKLFRSRDILELCMKSLT